jgi:WD40 repeat protein
MTLNLKRIGSVIILLVFSVLRGAGQKPELIVQTGHSAHVNAVALSPDGSILASSSKDGTIKLWNVATGAQLRTFYGGGGYSVAFNHDGTLIAAGSSDGVVRLWDVSTGVEVRTLGRSSNLLSTVAFSRDGKSLASIVSTKEVSSPIVKLWDFSTGSELRSFPGNGLNWIAFSPDGKFLAGSGVSNTIKLWDISTGTELRTLSGLAFVFSPDGKTLATISVSNINFTGPPGAIPNGTIKLWDVSSGKELRTTNPISADYLFGLLAFSSDGKSLATYGGMNGGVVRLWNTSSGSEWRSFTGVGRGPFVLSNDWKTLVAVGEGNTIALWDFTTGKQSRILTGQFPGIYSLAISANGKTLASGVGGGVDGMYGTIRIWDLSINPHVRTLTRSGGVTSIAFSPDGNLLASGTSDWDSYIKFWNVQTGALLGTYGPYSQIFGFSVAFGADWKTLAAGSSDKTIKIWDISTGTLLHNLTGHSEMVTAIAMSPDGKTLASGSSNNAFTIERKPEGVSNGSIKLWDIRTGTELRTIQSDSGWVYSVAFSPDGKTLATGADNSIKLWDVATGQNLHVLRGRDGRSLAFSPDGKILASGNSSSTLDLWNISTGTHRSLPAKSFGKIVFSRTNNYLFSGSEDSSITIWDTTLEKEIANLISLGTQDWIVTTPDGLFDGSSAACSQLLWRFNNNTFDYAPVEAFYNEFFYPGLLGEIIAGKRPKAPSQISKKDRRQPQLNLRLVDHQSGQTVTARNVRVQIDVSEIRADKEHRTNSGAQDVRLFRNGSLVKVWHGDVLKGRHSAVPIKIQETERYSYANGWILVLNVSLSYSRRSLTKRTKKVGDWSE